MRLYVAATGSGGNSFVLTGCGGESLVLDAGAPIKKVLPHVPDLRRVAGCLITHEHSDHAKYWHDYWMRGIRVIASAGTIRSMVPEGLPAMMDAAVAMRQMKCGGFTVMPFDVQHDAAEPFGYLIRDDASGEMLVYATDTYFVKYTFPGVHYWLVECNYCEDLVDAETDAVLRRRLKESHMSLRRLKDTLAANDLSETAKIVLMHLSDQRSDERRMVDEIYQQTGIETVAAAAGMEIELNRTPF